MAAFHFNSLVRAGSLRGEYFYSLIRAVIFLRGDLFTFYSVVRAALFAGWILLFAAWSEQSNFFGVTGHPLFSLVIFQDRTLLHSTLKDSQCILSISLNMSIVYIENDDTRNIKCRIYFGMGGVSNFSFLVPHLTFQCYPYSNKLCHTHLVASLPSDLNVKHLLQFYFFRGCYRRCFLVWQPDISVRSAALEFSSLKKK